MMAPAGFDHGRFASNIVAALKNYLSRRKLGVVATAETGFQISSNPDTVRAPDVAFVRTERIPSGGVKGFFPGPPDLAVEVVSPSDRTEAVAAKAQDWLLAGAVCVWVIDPEDRTVTIHQSRNKNVVLTSTDTLDGGDLLPGFSLPVDKVFA